MYTVVVRSPITNKGLPVCFFVTDREIIPTLEQWLTWLKTNFALKLKTIMIDCSATEVTAIKNVFNNDVQVLLCHWHIKRAWETNIKQKVKIIRACSFSIIYLTI